MSDDNEVTSDVPMNWYIVRVAPGKDKVAAAMLEQQIEHHKVSAMFENIVVPTEEIIESKMKNIEGKKKRVEYKKEKSFYPSYILVKMQLTPDTWHIVSKTPKIVGFIGGKKYDPSPLPEAEALKILSRVENKEDTPRHTVEYQIGDMIRIQEGPFEDFSGTIEEVHYDKNKLVVAVSIFGRSTPVELEFNQVVKI